MTREDAEQVCAKASAAFVRADAFYHMPGDSEDRRAHINAARDAYFLAFELRNKVERAGFPIKTDRAGRVQIGGAK